MMFENDIRIKIHDGTINSVDKSTQIAVKNAVEKINSIFSNGIFDGVTIHIASDYSNLPDSGSELNNYLKMKEKTLFASLGATLDNLKDGKEVFIQESAFFRHKLLNLFSSNLSFSADGKIEQTTLHEFGHLFNYTGGDKAIKQKAQTMAKEYDKIIGYSFSAEDRIIMEEYYKNDGFSDREDFKKAILADLKSLDLTREIAREYKDVLIEFYNNGLDVVPQAEYIENAENARNEIFAQLFSYILGGKDDRKDALIKMFPRTYATIEAYIEASKNE